MTTEEQILAVRHSVGLSDMSHVACVRVVGDDAYDALDAVCPAELYLRDGQMLHSLLLDDEARPVADLYVGRDDESFLLMAEGMSCEQLRRHLTEAAPEGLEVELRSLAGSHRLLSLNGPYAWELLAELVGPEVVGLPYLSFFHAEGVTCFRAGKAGEYGYELLAERGVADELERRLTELGQAFDLMPVGLEALDQCSLENWFFNIRREGRAGVTPVELQLQWRVASGKDFPGAELMRELRSRRPARRLTCLVGREPVAAGDTLELDGVEVGQLVNAGFSPVRRDWIALALVELSLAHPGIEGFVAARDGGRAVLRSVSPPVVHNRSLFVNPQQHGYRTRHEDLFPPVAPAGG